MATSHQTNWRLRIGLTFSFIIGAGWGLLLGWMQIRLNAWLSPWLVLGVAMPLAFAGSMITGLVFNRMTLAWHKVARVLVALLVVAFATPFGLAWGLFENGYNPAQLITETGAKMWDLEWLIAIVGLFAGMWPRWTLPFVVLFGRFARWTLAVPLAILHRIGQTIIHLLSPLGRIAGAIANVPALWKSPANGMSRVVQPRAITPPRVEAPAPAQTRPRRGRRSSILRRMRPQKAKVANNGSNGTRIVAHVEDRCP